MSTQPELTIFTFPGGGALGAYQAGVIEAMEDERLSPDWVVGTSIGAINAAIVAGNPPEQRLSKLKIFWERMAFNIANGRFEHVGSNPFNAGLMNSWNMITTFAYGLGGFFKPRPIKEFALGAKTSPQNASFYSTDALADTLMEVVDFDYLAQSPIRLSVGAVDINSGQMVYFDSQKTRLNAHHIMASGALPPAFPAIEIDGKFYWDGGVYSNTPLEWVLLNRPKVPSLCISATLWQKEDAPPQDLSSVLRRVRELQFSSRDESLVHITQTNHHLRNVAQTLARLLPEGSLDAEMKAEVDKIKGHPVLHLVTLEADRIAGETHNKHLDFAARRMDQRWEDGKKAAQKIIANKPWLVLVDPRAGIIRHEIENEKTEVE